jgi:hypothetical protein
MRYLGRVVSVEQMADGSMEVVLDSGRRLRTARPVPPSPAAPEGEAGTTANDPPAPRKQRPRRRSAVRGRGLRLTVVGPRRGRTPD